MGDLKHEKNINLEIPPNLRSFLIAMSILNLSLAWGTILF